MGEVVELLQYRLRAAARAAQPSEAAAPAEEQVAPDPEDFGWLVIETDEHGRPVRWFHPRWVAQLGILRDAPEWTFLDHAQQVRAWRSLDAGELALAMDRRIVPEAELTLPWRR